MDYIVRIGTNLDGSDSGCSLSFEADDDQGVFDLVDFALRHGYQALAYAKKQAE